MKKEILLLIITLLHTHLYTYNITNDTADFDSVGYCNVNIKTNGELLCLQRYIPCTGIVFDVGANKGQWSQFVLESKPDVTLYSFEPVPCVFKKLTQTLKEQKEVHLFNLALSKNVETKTLFFYDKNQDVTELSGLYHRPLVDSLVGVKPKQISLQTDTIDLFCKHHHIEIIDFLKIDTEGSELDILLGAYELLSHKQIKTIQFEYGGTYRDAQITLKEVYDLLSTLHYTIYRIAPDGLIEITHWRPELETFQYSNYLATAQRITQN